MGQGKSTVNGECSTPLPFSIRVGNESDIPPDVVTGNRLRPRLPEGTNRGTSKKFSNSVLGKKFSVRTGDGVGSVVRSPVISTPNTPRDRSKSTSSESAGEATILVRQLAKISLPRAKRVNAWVDDVLEKSKYKIVPCDRSGDYLTSRNSFSTKVENNRRDAQSSGENDVNATPFSSSFLADKRIVLDVESVPEPLLGAEGNEWKVWRSIEAGGDTWDIEDDKNGVKLGIRAIDLDSPRSSFLLEKNKKASHEEGCLCNW